jgi:GNAT superfamily N-acetyltransferase
MPAQEASSPPREGRTPMEPLTPTDWADLAALHRECLPDSLVSRLGHRYAEAFYRYASRSADERIFVKRDAGRIIGACVVSLRPETLTRRLAFGTPLLWSAFLGVLRPSVAGSLVMSLRPATIEAPVDLPHSLPKILLIFTSARVRSRGAGSALLADCERCLAARGHGRYLVQTIDDEANAALRFYARNGFVERGRCVEQGRRFRILMKEIAAGTHHEGAASGASGEGVLDTHG